MTRFATSQDGRRREGRDGSTTAAVMFVSERIQPWPPNPFPVVVTEGRTATRQGLIDWRDNRYSVPPELAATKVVAHQHGSRTSLGTTIHPAPDRHTMTGN